MGNITEVGDHTFDAEMLGHDPLGLMFFWAPGSEPCKSMTPIVEEIATQFAGTLKVAKMNVEDTRVTWRATASGRFPISSSSRTQESRSKSSAPCLRLN